MAIIQIPCISATQSEVCGQAASASPGSLLEMQFLWLCPDLLYRNLGAGPSDQRSVLSALQVILMHAKICSDFLGAELGACETSGRATERVHKFL